MMETLQIGDVNVRIDNIDAATGNIVSTEHYHNIVTDAGLAFLASAALNGGSTIGYLAVGTGTAPPLASDPALGHEVFRGLLTDKSSGTGTMTISFYLGSQSANGFTLTEGGLFTAPSGGSPIARVLTDPFAKTSANARLYTWVITIARA